MNIEFHRSFVSHSQQERLASFLVRDIGAFHDLVGFERLLMERTQDFVTVIQHEWVLSSPCSGDRDLREGYSN